MDTLFKNTVTQGGSFKEAWCEALWRRTEKLRDTVISDFLARGLRNTYHLGSDIQSSSVIETKNAGNIQRCPKANGTLGISTCEGVLSSRNPGAAQWPIHGLGMRAGRRSLQAIPGHATVIWDSESTRRQETKDVTPGLAQATGVTLGEHCHSLELIYFFW